MTVPGSTGWYVQLPHLTPGLSGAHAALLSLLCAASVSEGSKMVKYDRIASQLVTANLTRDEFNDLAEGLASLGLITVSRTTTGVKWVTLLPATQVAYAQLTIPHFPQVHSRLLQHLASVPSSGQHPIQNTFGVPDILLSAMLEQLADAGLLSLHSRSHPLAVSRVAPSLRD
jgi:hypothetical protein